MSSTPSRDNPISIDSQEPVNSSKQELLDQFEALSIKYAELERQYANLLVEYRNTEESFENARKETAQLESQLYSASRKVENAKKIQEEFLDVVSHELLTPLNGILGMTRILEELPLKTEIKESVDTIKLCGEDLERILRNLLDYIHLSKGEIEFIPNSFNLSECVESILKEYASTIYLKHLEITYLPDHGTYNSVEVDQERVEQILHVLLSNAVKFTNKGHIEIRSKIKQKARSFLQGQPGYEMILSVTDTGIGISEEDLQHVFRPFEQLDSSRNRTFGGIGIGLTLCKEIITQMNGSIIIDSEPGKGSTFAVLLPVHSVSRSRSTHPQVRLKPDLNVLATSSHANSQKLLSRILTDLNVNYQFADDKTLKEQSDRATKIWMIDYPANPFDTQETNELISIMRSRGYAIVGLLPLHMQLLPPIKNQVDIVVRKPLSFYPIANALAFASTIPDDDSVASQTDTSNLYSSTSVPRVLLAENNPVNQKIILHLLGMLGIYTDTVKNIEELIEKFEPNVYSSILINPGIKSSDNLQHIGELIEHVNQESKARIIALTGKQSHYTLDELQEVGFDTQVTLPTRLEVFANALQVSVD